MKTLKESLFDAAGRCLPGQHIGPVHHSRRHYFKFNAPNLGLAGIHGRVASIFGDHSLPSLSQFSERLANCQQNARQRPQNQGVFNGIAIPFVLPQARISDMGAALDETYLPAVGQALKQVSPDSHFSLSWNFHWQANSILHRIAVTKPFWMPWHSGQWWVISFQKRSPNTPFPQPASKSRNTPPPCYWPVASTPVRRSSRRPTC